MMTPKITFRFFGYLFKIFTFETQRADIIFKYQEIPIGLNNLWQKS